MSGGRSVSGSDLESRKGVFFATLGAWVHERPIGGCKFPLLDNNPFIPSPQGIDPIEALHSLQRGSFCNSPYNLCRLRALTRRRTVAKTGRGIGCVAGNGGERSRQHKHKFFPGILLQRPLSMFATHNALYQHRLTVGRRLCLPFHDNDKHTAIENTLRNRDFIDNSKHSSFLTDRRINRLLVVSGRTREDTAVVWPQYPLHLAQTFSSKSPSQRWTAPYS